MYADFDGDGQFTSPGEEITVQQLSKDALDATDVSSTIKVPVTITPPACQTEPFAVRIGVLDVYGVTTLDGFTNVFEDGYFTTEAGISGSYMQVINYKGVIH